MNSALMRLVNLTEHPVHLRCDGDIVEIAPSADSATARIPENQSDDRVVDTNFGRVEVHAVTEAWRVKGLPKPMPDTLLIVSRATAFKSRRKDLVFPRGLERDPVTKRILYATSLGSVRRRGGRWRIRQTTIAQRAASFSWYKSPTPATIATAFAVSTALAGTTLGVGVDGIHSPDAAYGILFAVAAILVCSSFLLSYKIWKNAARARLGRGTAYMVNEFGSSWIKPEYEEFRNVVESEFDSVMEVPGPSAAANWEWPLDETSARTWASRVDDLMRSFAAVRHNDDHLTANGLFLTAHWPVAFAFGAELANVRRGLMVNVFQRPSYGRAAWVAGYTREGRSPVPRLRTPHDFVRNRSQDMASVARDAVLDIRDFEVDLECADDASPPPHASDGEWVLVVVRLTGSPWGPFHDMLDPIEGSSLSVRNNSTSFIGSQTIRSVDLRITVDGYPVGREFELPWAAYPVMVNRIAEYLSDGFRSKKILLGMTVPQEIGVGLGMVSSSTRFDHWPDTIRPVVYQRGEPHFVVPELNLGRMA